MFGPVLRLLATCLLPSMLFGCATVYTEELAPIAIPSEAYPKISSSRVVIGLDPANDMGERGTHVASSQMGLIGAVVETAIGRSMEQQRIEQEKRMRDIKSAALEFNFGGSFRRALEAALQQVSWLNVKTIVREPSFQRGQAEALLSGASEDVVFVVDVFYRMEPDYSRITTTSYVVAYAKKPDLVSLVKARSPSATVPVLYQKKFTHEYPFEGQGVAPERAAQLWSLNSGAMVQRALHAGVKESARMIAEDLRKLNTGARAP